MSSSDTAAATNPADSPRHAVKRIEAVPPREHVESRRVEAPNNASISRSEPSPGGGVMLDDAPQNDSELEVILEDLEISSSSSRLITVDELERRYIERVLAVTSGNKSRAAQILGFDRRTLYRKIERYGRSS